VCRVIVESNGTDLCFKSLTCENFHLTLVISNNSESHGLIFILLLPQIERPIVYKNVINLVPMWVHVL
jgi:hypothetical protein